MFSIYLTLIRPLYYLHFGAIVKLTQNKISKKEKKRCLAKINDLHTQYHKRQHHYFRDGERVFHWYTSYQRTTYNPAQTDPTLTAG